VKLLALDLSKSCTGWAFWKPGDERAVLGHFTLGGSYASNGDVFAKLQQKLNELRIALGFDRMVWEQKVNPQNLQAVSNYQTIALMGGLEAHAESFAAVFRIPYRAVNVSSWRPDFLGRDEIAGIRKAVKVEEQRLGKKVGTSDALKVATMLRARQLGYEPRKQDEADALGVLTYELLHRGMTPPWLANETLRAPLEAASC
jgi:hypothetical protein